MRNKRFIPAALVLAALIFSASLSSVRAGDEEWARFGRGVAILTGLSILHNIMWVRPHVSVRYEYEHRAADRRQRHCTHHHPKPKKVVIHKTAKPAKTDKNTSYIESDDERSLTGEKSGKGDTTGATSTRKIEDATAIILDLGNGRRLYQAKVKGQKAQVQVWSEIEKRWVGIKEYPSLY